MNTIKRIFSLLIRHVKKPFSLKSTIRKLQQWRSEQTQLLDYQPIQQKLLIIRLDEIGDYILFRNCLPFFKASSQWKHHHITLLGNKAWKSIFDFTDGQTVDASIWLDKQEYNQNENYRFEIWKQLRREGFETVICPTRIRTVWFDDFCALATGSPNTIAVDYAYPEKQVNTIIGDLYKIMYRNSKIYHEFFFNQDFANWCCLTNYHLERPKIDLNLCRQPDENYLICYIGASKKSRRIVPATWIELIQLLKENYGQKIILAGGPEETTTAGQIAAAANVNNITGKVSLAEMICYTAFADAVITGDTMQSHLAVACNVPTVIVANGNTFARFSEYKLACIKNVETVYAKPFMKAWKKKNYALFLNYAAVTDDIRTIKAKDILQALQRVKPNL